MARKTKKKLHPIYIKFLKERCNHVNERTRHTYEARLRNFPSPTRLTIKWFNSRIQDISPHTAQAELVTIRMFKSWEGASRDILDTWKKQKTNGTGKLSLRKLTKSVTVADIYKPDELEKIFGACTTIRNRALIEVFYESAVRAGELISMRLENTQFDKDGIATLLVSGKTGIREVYLNHSVPALRKWINTHPLRKEGRGPLWTFANISKPIKRPTLYNLVNAIIKRANLGRTPKKIGHMFRHTRITELVKLGWRGQALNKLVGWTENSNMESIYVHLSNQDVKDQMRVMFGKDVEPIHPMLTSNECPNCKSPHSQSEVICENCSFPLTQEKLVKAVFDKKENKRTEYRIKALEDMIVLLSEKLGLDTSYLSQEEPDYSEPPRE